MTASLLSRAIRTALLGSAGLAVVALPAVAADQSAASITDALTGGDAALDLRYRFEGVDQDNAAKDAAASTLRTRLTWGSGNYRGFTVGVELDDVTAIGDDNYNSTTNGNGDYSVVADPTGTEVNRAFLKYTGEDYAATAGRQRINIEGQRLVGGVGWRQNEQTYDGYRFQYGSANALSLDYSYVYKVKRIFGEDSPNGGFKGDVQVLNASYPLAEGHRLSATLLDLSLEDAVNLSSRTLSVNYAGTYGPLKARLGIGQQTESGDSTLDYRAPYYEAELATNFGPVNAKVGLEVLGSDNGVGFSTPLATLHKFQGFADQFLTTPAEGVEDRYLGVSTKLLGGNLGVTYHNFVAAEGSATWGNELDISYGRKLTERVSGVVKYAAYDADEHGVDTNKLWLMVSAKF